MDNYTIEYIDLTPISVGDFVQEFIYEQVPTITPVYKDTLVVTSSNVNLLELINFSYGDAPRLIKTIPANTTLFCIDFNLQIPFNTLSNIQIKDENNNIICELGLLSQEGIYSFSIGQTFTTETNLYLYINSIGGTTQGSGNILLTII